MMFKMMRACINIRHPDDLWINKRDLGLCDLFAGQRAGPLKTSWKGVSAKINEQGKDVNASAGNRRLATSLSNADNMLLANDDLTVQK